MANESTESERSEIGEFFSYIYGDSSGYSYMALKSPDAEHHNFVQHFFQYPTQLVDMIDLAVSRRETHEVYYSPALFKVPSAKKEEVSGANVYWVEFDGTVPAAIEGVPEPTLRIQSSLPGHEHWYWKSESFVGPFDLERVNRALTYLLGADASGWDANQILRPIHTTNHKRSANVRVLQQTGETVAASSFGALPDAPASVDVPIPTEIPDVTDVIARYKFGTVLWSLFKQGRPEGKRSEGLMALGYYLAEMQLTNGEIFAMILNADMRWGKFKDRSDQLQRLAEIVTKARQKYPLKEATTEGDELGNAKLLGLGFSTFLLSEYNFEWVWDGWLQTKGYFLLTGPSGVGKTQFSLDAAMHLALGDDFLEREIPAPMKIGMLSLEMGGADLQMFAKMQASGYNKEQLEKLEQNLVIEALGEPVYMDTDEGKKLVEEWIGDNHLQGVIIDSLGSSVAGELSSEASVKQLMDWNDHLRQKLECFTWFIHHHRKATGENKKPNKLADVYGSHWITARATSVVCLWDLGIQGTLQAIPLKMRMSPDKDPFNIYRGGDLKFTKKMDGITILTPQASEAEMVTDAPVENVLDAGTGSGM